MPTVAIDSDDTGFAAAAAEALRGAGAQDEAPQDETAGLRDKCHEYLQALCLDMARETLRSPDIELFHEDSAALYTHLADYFEIMKDRQAHQAAIALSPAHVKFVLRDVFGQAHLSSTASNLGERKAMQAVQGEIPTPDDAQGLADLLKKVADTSRGPLMSQRALREQLQAANVNVAALSEVLELSRFLDQQFGHTVPFGQVNVTHAAAVMCSLLPSTKLYDVVAAVFEALPATRGAATGPDGRPGSARGTPVYRAADVQKIRLFHCWATIDDGNRAALEKLQLCLLQRPNLSLPLLLEVMPSVRAISSAAHEAAEAAESAAKTTVVEYNEEDTGPSSSSGAAAAASGPIVASYDEDDVAPANAGDDDDAVSSSGAAEGGDPAAEAGGGFWSALVAPPSSE